jgi:CheY-like chemotaxis protein
MKVLLVDDDVFLREMYVTKFTERGDIAHSASSGQAALDILATGAMFDVIVLDMVMPQMTGVELLQEIKSKYPHQRCIVLSNQSESFDREAAESAGAIGYIVKADMVPSEVVERVHAILEEIAVTL